MYETRLVGGGGRGSGMGGLGGASRGPLDLVLNGLVGILLVYLAWTVVEPFWASTVASSQQVKIQTDAKVLSDALNRYRHQEGHHYRDKNLRALSTYLSQTPKDPWGNEYVVDPVVRRVMSGGADGVLGARFDSEEAQDDHIFFYQHPLHLRLIVHQGAQFVPIEMRMDGWEQIPVQGEFLPGVREFVQDPTSGDVFYVAQGVDQSLDIAHRPSGSTESTWFAEGPGEERFPVLGDQGHQVFFQAIRTAREPLIYQRGLQGGEILQVTEPPDRLDHPDWGGDYSPSVSLEKNHLAFHSIRGSDGKMRICFVPRSKPRGPVVVLKAPEPAGRFPIWSKDEKKVYFLSESGKTVEAIPFPPRGQNRPPAINLGRVVAGYSLSPEEDFLITYSDQPGAPVEIVEVATGDRREIFSDPGIVVYAGWIP